MFCYTGCECNQSKTLINTNQYAARIRCPFWCFPVVLYPPTAVCMYVSNVWFSKNVSNGEHEDLTCKLNFRAISLKGCAAAATSPMYTRYFQLTTITSCSVLTSPFVRIVIDQINLATKVDWFYTAFTEVPEHR